VIPNSLHNAATVLVLGEIDARLTQLVDDLFRFEKCDCHGLTC
jgi:hypothetical protein